MLKLPIDQLIPLVEALRSFVGSDILIQESISQSRDDYGYDFVGAARSLFQFDADMVVGPDLSHVLFGIASKRVNFYCLSIDDIVEFYWNEDKLTITEHYEKTTGRRTVIQRTLGVISSQTHVLKDTAIERGRCKLPLRGTQVMSLVGRRACPYPPNQVARGDDS